LRFSARDLAAVAAILRSAAAVEIMPRFRKLAPGGVRTKSGPLDLVTDADEAAEARITAALHRDFPGCLVVGEEAASADPDLIGRLAAAELAFTIDPVDGTSNFAAGLPLFGVMAAVVQRGHTVAGIILDPVCDSYSAARLGAGAFETAADGSSAALHVASPVPIAAMTGMVSWRFMPEPLRDRVLPALPQFAQTWDHRCAAHEYRALIAGHSHFVVFNRLMPWDHLAGVLLHAEAGGVHAKFDGSRYLAGETSGGLICAPSHAARSAVAHWLLGL
jgi:fructose-1,6-bisphosphatase/inositol monophosphatase family enzyme